MYDFGLHEDKMEPDTTYFGEKGFRRENKNLP